MLHKAKVSALCVTRHRVPWLRRSIECFMLQTYTNKELVVVYDSDDISTKTFIKQLQNVPLVCVENSKHQKLGALRNMSVQAATGDFVMQWDDDDYYQNNRIECMLSHLSESSQLAVCTRWTVFDLKREKMYISAYYDFEGTMIASKDLVMKCPYPEDNVRFTDGVNEWGEDTVAVNKMKEITTICRVDLPESYLYTVHEKNTCSDSHFEKMYAQKTYEYSYEDFVKTKKQLFADTLIDTLLQDAACIRL